MKVMLIRQAFKFELRPNGEQESLMRRFAGCCRFVYNRGLAIQRERYETGEKHLGYGALCKERNMSRSASGTVEAPGKQVKAKSGLNKAILDQGWYELRRQLAYKLHWNGGQLIAVPPHNTSRSCPKCNHVSKENRRTQAQFACVQGGYKENADLVGAINILRAGHARLACEVSGAVRPPAAGTHRSELGKVLPS